jgi:DNA-binding PadR family transcriptional regulator
MSIRMSLLAILDQGACYGNQLRLEYERRTGGIRPLNSGQVYKTLDAVESEGLVTRGSPAPGGYTLFAITSAGTSSAAARSELATKVTLALTLPGVDVPRLIGVERDLARAVIASHRGRDGESPERELLSQSLVLAAEAELLWLDHCENHAARERPYALATEPPKRGRPARLTLER